MSEAKRDLVAEMEQQKKRKHALDAQKVKLQTQVDHYMNEYQKCCNEAQELFGTTDIAELRELLADRKKKNEHALQSFTDGLNEAEAQLKQIQNILSEAQA